MLEPSQLAPGWLAAARDPAISTELEAIYALVADQIEARGPACWASGRCCQFRAAGHRLYVTGLEAAYTVARLHSPITEACLDAGEAAGACPLLTANLCGAHQIKPLGCRVYFCDRTAQAWQQDLSERALGLIRGLHDRHGIEYRYGEWLAMLRAVHHG